MSRLLTFNCHEGYVHLLGKLGCDLDIIDGLPGRYTRQWDTRMRPVPPNARLIRLETAIQGSYDVAIAHNVTDLLSLKHLHLPKVLVLHVSLEARAREEPDAPPVDQMRSQIAEYLSVVGGTAVAVSQMKATSWGLPCTVIRPCAAPNEYYGYCGQLPRGLRVANQVSSREQRFAWPQHQQIVRDLSWALVGHNPTIEGSQPAASWYQLQLAYRNHRAYIHTAGPGLDDGYNMALVEAMATGMPIVSLNGSESPIEDGVNGFVGSDCRRLHAALEHLLKHRKRALEMGKRARDTALNQFSVKQFVDGWHQAIEQSRRTFSRTT